MSEPAPEARRKQSGRTGVTVVFHRECDMGTVSSTSEAKRKRSGRVRLGLVVAKLTGREVRMRFHPSESCGGHLPWSLSGRLLSCPDAAWDLSRGKL